MKKIEAPDVEPRDLFHHEGKQEGRSREEEGKVEDIV